MTNVSLFNLFHLFTFVPLVGLGGILWFERMLRHPSQKRTLFLFFSLVSLTFVGIFQVIAATFPALFPSVANYQVIASSLLGYFIAFTTLEYSIHCKRIDESFLDKDFFRGLKPMFIFLGIAAGLILVGWLYLPSWRIVPDRDSWAYSFQTIMVGQSLRGDALAVYKINVSFLSVLTMLSFLVVFWIGGRNIFNLQKGVIRMRSYPYMAGIAAVLAYGIYLLFQRGIEGVPPAGEVVITEAANTLPLWYFVFLNLVYALRMVEEFFFWSQYNLRSDRNRIEQRQHTLNVLIRRVITSPEEEDRAIVKETVESGLEKIRSRMVVHEYNITGLVIYRVHGNVLKIDTPDHLFGYCSPLVDNKSFKNLDKEKLNDMILRTSYDVREIMNTPEEAQKDYGKLLFRKLIEAKDSLVIDALPENYKGLQRMIGLHPIFDGNNFMGALVYFKDSFNKLYPAEKEILSDLCENLGTIFALMQGKEIQKERNRLQGEMQSAKNIQTSILPKKMELEGYEVHASMETATEVGGDVYDIIPHKFGNYLAVGDVAGHGLPAGMMAALQMAAFQGALEASKVLDKEIRVDALYDAVNRVLCTINRDRIGSDKFMTANYFVEKQGTLHHAGTNTIPLMYKHATGEVVELPGLTDRTAFLGISEFVDSTNSYGQFKMESGDILMLYSDGLIEAKDHYDHQYGTDPVKNIILQNLDKPLSELDTIIRAQVKEFAKNGDLKKNGGHFSDDVTIVYIRKN